MKIKQSREDRIFGFIVNTILILGVLACFYPLYLVVINSFSDPSEVALGNVYIVPKGFSLDAYKKVFEDGELMRGYANALYHTIMGTALNMLFTIPCAYALSKKKLYGGKLVMRIFIVTMYFSGGLIPTYLLIQGLGLLNTHWAVILMGCLSVTNLIIARTFFTSSIPAELEEAAEIDGCSPVGSFFKIALPLSKAMLSVILLYYAVGRWNNYTYAMYYMPLAQNKYPLQMVLRKLVILIQDISMSAGNDELEAYYAKLQSQIKYSVIVVASVPLMILYPFIQKYFEKGVMLGSVKG